MTAATLPDHCHTANGTRRISDCHHPPFIGGGSDSAKPSDQTPQNPYAPGRGQRISLQQSSPQPLLVRRGESDLHRSGGVACLLAANSRVLSALTPSGVRP